MWSGFVAGQGWADGRSPCVDMVLTLPGAEWGEATPASWVLPQLRLHRFVVSGASL